jgi:hypothetical protein
MADSEAVTAILISAILGIILSVIFDGVFILALVGFMATYLTKPSQRHILVGIVASLLVGFWIFLYGLLFANPPIPSEISVLIGVDIVGFMIGFMVICTISIILGTIGSYVATLVSRDDQSN